MSTDVLPAIWALRMRVSISDRGSCMLIIYNSPLPAGLNQPRHIAAHGRLSQLVPTQAELAIHPVWATRELAATSLTHRTRITRQFLQRDLGIPLLLIR